MYGHVKGDDDEAVAVRMQATAAEQEEMELELDISAARPEAADQAQIEALIAQHLTDGLQLFPHDVLASALHDFVEKVGLTPP